MVDCIGNCMAVVPLGNLEFELLNCCTALGFASCNLQVAVHVALSSMNIIFRFFSFLIGERARHYQG